MLGDRWSEAVVFRRVARSWVEPATRIALDQVFIPLSSIAAFNRYLIKGWTFFPARRFSSLMKHVDVGMVEERESKGCVIGVGVMLLRMRNVVSAVMQTVVQKQTTFPGLGFDRLSPSNLRRLELCGVTMGALAQLAVYLPRLEDLRLGVVLKLNEDVNSSDTFVFPKLQVLSYGPDASGAVHEHAYTKQACNTELFFNTLSSRTSNLPLLTAFESTFTSPLLDSFFARYGLQIRRLLLPSTYWSRNQSLNLAPVYLDLCGTLEVLDICIPDGDGGEDYRVCVVDICNRLKKSLIGQRRFVLSDTMLEKAVLN